MVKTTVAFGPVINLVSFGENPPSEVSQNSTLFNSRLSVAEQVKYNCEFKGSSTKLSPKSIGLLRVIIGGVKSWITGFPPGPLAAFEGLLR